MSEKQSTIFRPGKRTLGEIIEAKIVPADIMGIAQSAMGMNFSSLSWETMMNVANLAILDETDYVTLDSSISECVEKYSEALVDGGFL